MTKSKDQKIMETCISIDEVLADSGLTVPSALIAAAMAIGVQLAHQSPRLQKLSMELVDKVMVATIKAVREGRLNELLREEFQSWPQH